MDEFGEGKIEIASDLDDYMGFFDKDWAKDLFKLTKGTSISTPAFYLAMSFAGQSYAREMPVRMFGLMKTFVTTVMSQRKPFPVEVLDEYLNSIHKNPDGAKPLSNRQRKIARKRLKEAEEIVNQKRGTEIVDIHVDKLWDGLVKDDPTLALCLWRSELNAYAGLYFAYEDFVRQCYVIISAKIFNAQKSAKVLREVFGEELVKTCWTDKNIHAARLIRHAIAHASGRITDDIKAAKVKVRTAGENLLIGAKETTEVHALLKNRALIFATAAVEELKDKQPST